MPSSRHHRGARLLIDDARRFNFLPYAQILAAIPRRRESLTAKTNWITVVGFSAPGLRVRGARTCMAAGSNRRQPQVHDLDQLLGVGVAERLFVQTVKLTQHTVVKLARWQRKKVLLSHVPKVDAGGENDL